VCLSTLFTRRFSTGYRGQTSILLRHHQIFLPARPRLKLADNMRLRPVWAIEQPLFTSAPLTFIEDLVCGHREHADPLDWLSYSETTPETRGQHAAASRMDHRATLFTSASPIFIEALVCGHRESAWENRQVR
jgi:hypothetical protein